MRDELCAGGEIAAGERIAGGEIVAGELVASVCGELAVGVCGTRLLTISVCGAGDIGVGEGERCGGWSLSINDLTIAAPEELHCRRNHSDRNCRARLDFEVNKEQSFQPSGKAQLITGIMRARLGLERCRRQPMKRSAYQQQPNAGRCQNAVIEALCA